MKKLFCCLAVAAACSLPALGQTVFYNRTTENANRANFGNGTGPSPTVIFDDVPIPVARLAGSTRIDVTRLTVGIRRLAAAPATDVNVYWTTMTTDVTDPDTEIDTPPNLLQTVSLPANGAAAVTQQVILGDGLATLFTVDLNPDLIAGFGTFSVGVSFSNTNANNGWRMTDGPDGNADIIWTYDPDLANPEDFGNFGGAPVAAFYIRVEGNVVPATGACCLTDGTCDASGDAAACASAGGSYQGNFTDCTGISCGVPQACCFSDGSCQDLIEADCRTQNGVPQGTGSACSSTTCTFCFDTPVGAIDENEPNCGQPTDTVNGGCLSSPPVFSNIACGQTYYSTAGTTGTARDTDWYRVVTTTDQQLTFTVTASFPVLVGLVDNNGVSTCPGALAFQGEPVTAVACAPAIVSFCLPPGEWWFFVAPSTFSGVTCRRDYIATLDCVDCIAERGACCETDGSCTPDVTPFECEVSGGTYQGSGSICFEGGCEQPEACCFLDGTCQNLRPTDCNANGGFTQGFGTVCGPAITCPICADCPVGATQENEPDCDATTDTVNGGCFFTPTRFLPVTCPQTYCGTAHNDGTFRDTDWYQITVTQETEVRIAVTSEFAALLVLVDTGGNPVCPNPIPIRAQAITSPCTETVLTNCLPPGTWWLVVTTNSFDGVDCGARYTARFTCSTPCTTTPGACCLRDGSCQQTQELACDALGGRFSGTGTVCTPNPCPQDPSNDDCGTATVIPSVPFNDNIDTFPADSGPPSGSCNSADAITADTMDQDVWYRWSPATACLARLTVTTPDYDAIAVVYRGSCAALEELACGDEPQPIVIEFAAVPGETYFIQIGDWGVTDGGGATQVALECLDAPGACCIEGQPCTQLTEPDCTAQLGTYQGPFSSCGDASELVQTYSAPGLPQAIPDNNPGGVTAIISVPDSFIVGDVNLPIDITHTFRSDLRIIVQKDAVQVIVFDQNCGAEDNLVVTFDDEGVIGDCAALAGNVQPINPLAAFDGIQAQGDWFVTVTDVVDQDTGTLNAVSVELARRVNDPCVPNDDAGGCCLADDSCLTVLESECTGLGGSFQGAGTDCASITCGGDPCAGSTRGDSNCDGFINFDDIDCFVAALISEAAWNTCGHQAGCDYVCTNSTNGDAFVNFDDIDSFIECLIFGACP